VFFAAECEALPESTFDVTENYSEANRRSPLKTHHIKDELFRRICHAPIGTLFSSRPSPLLTPRTNVTFVHRLSAINVLPRVDVNYRVELIDSTLTAGQKDRS